MTQWHGYILLEKPTALTMGQWRTVLIALRPIFNTDPNNPQPCRRLHWRRNLGDTRIIVEATFDSDDLNIENLNRLARYISEALEGAYTPEQCCNAMRNNITLWSLHGEWLESNALCRGYLTANAVDWEEEEV